jgi:hypothetical protein
VCVRVYASDLSLSQRLSFAVWRVMCSASLCRCAAPTGAGALAAVPPDTSRADADTWCAGVRAEVAARAAALRLHEYWEVRTRARVCVC